MSILLSLSSGATDTLLVWIIQPSHGSREGSLLNFRCRGRRSDGCALLHLIVLATPPLTPAQPVTLGRRRQRHVGSFRVIPLSFLGRAVFPVGICWCACGPPW